MITWWVQDSLQVRYLVQDFLAGAGPPPPDRDQRPELAHQRLAEQRAAKQRGTGYQPREPHPAADTPSVPTPSVPRQDRSLAATEPGSAAPRRWWQRGR